MMLCYSVIVIDLGFPKMQTKIQTHLVNNHDSVNCSFFHIFMRTS